MFFFIHFMSVKNKKIIERIIKEFTTKNYSFCLELLTDDIRWNIVGMPPINGKSNFVSAFEMMELWQKSSTKMEDASHSCSIKNIIAEGDFVVVESKGIKNNNPAYCDIYHLRGGKIDELTTYIVDLGEQ